MSYKRTGIRGTLSFDCHFDIEAGDPRPVQYTSTGARYRVEWLTFSLLSEALDDSKHPRYKDLKVSALSLGGHKLKKDGTPGTVETKESFSCWGTREWPTWINAIISETVQELRGTRPVGGQ
jgi:hypothetical protein